MTERSRVVFLSYASQDAAAALRIADALRNAGVEVWLDQSELRGGDAWDRQIRELIHECWLFVPIISANTEARDEGYFRREWRLAVDRTHDMSERKAFLVPVVIDDTPQRGASVPDKFRDVQWTYLPAGERSPEFIARIARLLSPESGPPPPRASSGGAPQHSTRPGTVEPQPVAVCAQQSPASRIQKHEPSRSVAVLPFANLSSEREQEYFSDGLTEEVINQLAHVRGLRVLARTSSFAFKGKNEDLRVIGEKLSAGYVLEGSVRKAGKRLRITAQLVDCADGYHLWSEIFDRDLDDVFAVQHDISKSVASALGVALGFSDDVSTRGTHNLEAYDLVLRARALVWRFGPTENERAASLYREALVFDPDYAAAWAGLATTMMMTVAYYSTQSAEAATEWEHAVHRALALAPELWNSQVALGSLEAYRHNWHASERAFEKALELAPQSESTPSRMLAVRLLGFGRCDDAIGYMIAARKIEPLSLFNSGFLQLAFTVAGRDDEAETEYRRGRDLTGNQELAELLALQRALMRRLPATAVRQHMQQYLSHASIILPVQSELLGLIERPETARARLRLAAEDNAYQDSYRQFRIALLAVQFGDVDLALSALRRAQVEMRGISVYLLWLPTLADARKDPRFKELLRDLKIVDYWRASGRWGDFAWPLDAENFEVR